MLPRVSLDTPLATNGKGGLSGCTIVELSRGGVSSSSACALLVDAGANVIKLEAPHSGDAWRSCNPASFAQFNRGKSSTVVDLHDRSDLAAVFTLLHESTAFVTNYSVKELELLGLGPADIRKKIPELVYAIVSPWGLGNTSGPPGEKGAFFGYGGIASCMQKPEHQPPELPDQVCRQLVRQLFPTAESYAHMCLYVHACFTYLVCMCGSYTLTTFIVGRGVRVILLVVWDYSSSFPPAAHWGRATRRLCHASVCNLDDQSDYDHRLKATKRWRVYDSDQHVFDAGVSGPCVRMIVCSGEVDCPSC